MKLPFFQTTETQANKFLSLSINSKDVRCLALYYDSGSYKIIGYGREELERGSVRNGVIIDRDDVVRAVKGASLMATENLEEKVSDVIVGISGDLCVGLVTTVRFRKQNPGFFDKKEIENLYKKIDEASEIQAQNEYLETTGNPDLELGDITTSNVLIKVDGHTVKDLEGVSGTTVEAAVFKAYTPIFHLKSLQDVAKKAGLRILALGSEMFAMSEWIKEYSPGLSDFVLMSVDNESTNAAVVFGGGIVSTKSLGIGFTHFIDNLSEKTGLTLIESEKMLKNYIANKLTESESVMVQKCVMETLTIWLLGLEILFNEFTNVKTFAPTIYLTGYGAEIKDVLATLKSEPWTKSIPFGTFPDILKVNFSDFSKISDGTGKVSGPEWLTNISMAIIYEEIFGK